MSDPSMLPGGSVLDDDMVPGGTQTKTVIDALLNDSLTTWEMITDAGRGVSSEASMAQLVLGHLALKVNKSYGKNQIGAFAAQVGRAKGSIIKYRRVAEAWPLTVALEYPEASFSILETIAFKELDGKARMDWLQIAVAEDLSVDALTKRILGEEKPHKAPPLVIQAGEVIVMALGGGTNAGYVGLAVDNIQAWKEQAIKLGFLDARGNGVQAKLVLRLPEMKQATSEAEVAAAEVEAEATATTVPAPKRKGDRKKASAAVAEVQPVV